MRRLLAGLITVLTLSSLLAGCSMLPQLACPAIGWIATLTVKLEGSVQNVHSVELCVEGVCSVTAEQLHQSDVPLEVVTAIPQETVAPTAQPATPPLATEVNDRTWTFNLMMGAPKVVTARALSADGATIIGKEVALSWKRVGGSEQCGGPVEAPPIKLTIPG